MTRKLGFDDLDRITIAKGDERKVLLK